MSLKEVKVIGKQSIPVLLRTTKRNYIHESVKSISFSNVGAGVATVLDVVLNPGETVNFNAEVGNYFSGGIFKYDASASELLIAYIM